MDFLLGLFFGLCEFFVLVMMMVALFDACTGLLDTECAPSPSVGGRTFLGTVKHLVVAWRRPGLHQVMGLAVVVRRTCTCWCWLEAKFVHPGLGSLEHEEYIALIVLLLAEVETKGESTTCRCLWVCMCIRATMLRLLARSYQGLRRRQPVGQLVQLPWDDGG